MNIPNPVWSNNWGHQNGGITIPESILHSRLEPEGMWSHSTVQYTHVSMWTLSSYVLHILSINLIGKEHIQDLFFIILLKIYPCFWDIFKWTNTTLNLYRPFIIEKIKNGHNEKVATKMWILHNPLISACLQPTGFYLLFLSIYISSF